VDTDKLPPQLRVVLNALAVAMRNREPAIRGKVEELRAKQPELTADELADRLIKSTRYRVAASGAAVGAAAIAPGLGTIVTLGTATGQSVYALEQEAELVLAIAIIFGHDLAGSDERLLEALVVVGLAGGAVKLREDVLVVGGQRIAIEAFRRLPQVVVTHAGGRMLKRILARVATSRTAVVVARAVPLAVGMAVGAGFDWVAVSALGKAAKSYYGPGGPASRWPVSGPALPAAEDRADVEAGG
jgi:hypothetical protein